jgi:hypothetical protein
MRVDTDCDHAQSSLTSDRFMTLESHVTDGDGQQHATSQPAGEDSKKHPSQPAIALGTLRPADPPGLIHI